MNTVEQVLHLFDTEGRRKTSKGYMVRCVLPSHPDNTASLSLSNGKKDGRDILLIKCFGGCPTEGILDYINKGVVGNWERTLPIHELKKLAGINPEPEVKYSIEKVYDYTDAKGTLLFQSVRWKPKKFSYRRPASDRERYDMGIDWVWSLEGVKKVLYNLPEIKASGDEFVFIVEGEKASDTLRENGYIATCPPCGGASEWLESYTESLAGKNVIVIPDHDTVGYKRCQDLFAALKSKVNSFRFLPLPGLLKLHDDVYDWFNIYNNNMYQFNTLVSQSRNMIDMPVSDAVNLMTFEMPEQAESVKYKDNDLISVDEMSSDFESFIQRINILADESNDANEDLCQYCQGTYFVKNQNGLATAEFNADGKLVLRKCPTCFPRQNAFDDAFMFDDHQPNHDTRQMDIPEMDYGF